MTIITDNVKIKHASILPNITFTFTNLKKQHANIVFYRKNNYKMLYNLLCNISVSSDAISFNN